MTELEFRRRLFGSAASLRAHIQSKIPPAYQGVLAAEDVLQDTWITAFRRNEARGTADLRSFDEWLTSIANRRLIDAIRLQRTVKRGGRRHRVSAAGQASSLLNLFHYVASPGKTPSSELATREAVLAVRAAVERLPGPERRAVWLRHVEGQTHEAIARSMNITVGALRHLLSRGIDQLRGDLPDPAQFFSDDRSTTPDCADATPS